ncbi:MAG TPA: FMN-binding glutamate synthase family protein [Intrasporangium sp.]|uniref:FMN-binding glutamate synthase family protein n=1 Tax=Intrasporangium sp. TaxID=1925024 RepID=UPI002D78ED99|nr:FMN-binding glutamate synthase family protein [Intrasporangium sp.]HET7398835.1 FMN-binding glutamate synthase family protein [Intrasporangium sp.]
MRTSRIASALSLVGLGGVAAYDLLQKKHALLRTFPVVGHGRYLVEKLGPELRQYIVARNDEERPFSRDQRSWVYASAKLENNYTGFGSDNDLEYAEGYPVVKQRTFAAVAPPTDVHRAVGVWLPSAKVLGAARSRRHAFRPDSVINVSAMSFGSLSAPAIRAINEGVALAGALHNTGEGGLSDHHRHGGDLVFQIGTAYFGCRDEQGRFDLKRLVDLVASAPVKAIEVKLSQGAKPGLGGVLPAAKVTPEIARIRGIRQGVDCISPSRHAEFADVDSMLDWVEKVADATGLPVGIKSAVGHLDFWEELVGHMSDGSRGVDFVTVDGGEGGTGAAPMVFSDTVSLPFRTGFAKVYRLFAEAGLTDGVTFMGAGKLGLPENAVVAFALGVDMVNVAREAMLAIGCIQAQKCHTDTCPTGVATQSAWLSRGVDPTAKSVRLANYLKTWRRDMFKISEAAGVPHPALLGVRDIDIMYGQMDARPMAEVVGYRPEWGMPSKADLDELLALLAGSQPHGGSAPPSEHAER